jgi:glycosyltransferase involved in cell wall biosynthesis
MASGVPTVAFNYGAARETLRDGVHGAAIADGDDAGFIDACTRIGNDDALRHAMGTAARNAVADLRPDQVAADFDRILQSLADVRSLHGIASVA